MLKRLQVVFLLFIATVGFAQDKVLHRVIFIGDAGEINFKQETIVSLAADLILPEKTTVLYLGDNIYPRGLGLPGSPDRLETEAILKSQFIPLRAKGAPVYFVPGNHDWDRMGELGLEKIRAQGEFLASQQDSLLKLVPANGCPDPVEIPLSSNAVMIAYDSEWWLFPYDKGNPNESCECNTKEEVLEKFEELFYKNRDKTILLASHHPFKSFGVHGGYYSLKDHLFPFTVLKKNLYIPLPVIGSLYPLLRTTVFLNPEDMPHPLYKDLIEQVSGVFKGYPNLIYVAGHEHGLQLIKTGDQHQVVSGSGAKSSYLKSHKDLLYKQSNQGFVLVDLMQDKSTKLTYYTYENQSVKVSFEYIIPFVEETPEFAELIKDGADSLVIQANPKYDQVGKRHRKLFGENYRKEWAAPTKVPALRVSEIAGGLKPIQRGGGMQTISLRLEDSTGTQWVLRSVNKSPNGLLPRSLHNTFAADFLDDAVSAQHPYSALMVPPIANAVNVAHTEPVIGWVLPDTALGVYNLSMANSLALLEKREPYGKSDNTPKMLSKIQNDNDDTFDAENFHQARMLDLLIGDWDRHGDQFRWLDELQGKNKDYRAIPRDRDQVLRVMQGFFPYLVSRSWAIPTIQGFGPNTDKGKYYLLKSSFLNARPEMQFDKSTWNSFSADFVSRVTDSVLQESVKRLPESSYEIRHEQILSDLKERRNSIPSTMEKYYEFINSIADIRLSDKNEWVSLEDTPENGIRVVVRKINDEGERKGKLMDKEFDPLLTKEIRLYLSAGVDSVQINIKNSPIKVRIIGGKGQKDYQVQQAAAKVSLYDHGNSTLRGESDRLKLHYSPDSAHTSFVPVNLYNVTMPLISLGYDVDDGLILGAGFKYTHQRGFRKTPYTHTQQVLFSGSVSTGSFKINYQGRWREAVGKADLLVDADAFAPNNTQNFFGMGNNTKYDKDNHSIRYYRTRFNLYELKPALQWTQQSKIFKIGPALQYYSYAPGKNRGRFIENIDQLNSYDSLHIDENKLFVGLRTEFTLDNRDNALMPSSGGRFDVQLNAYTGLNKFSKSFAQLTTELSFYKGFLDDAVIIANRMGGGATLGKTTFYQSLFLGGHDNLLGLRKYRYAGEHMVYNNLEARIKLTQIRSYIFPGQLGLLGFYDVGKTWTKGHNSKDFHHGVGGGFYYVPAQMLVIRGVAGYSEGSWYPFFGMGVRF